MFYSSCISLSTFSIIIYMISPPEEPHLAWGVVTFPLFWWLQTSLLSLFFLIMGWNFNLFVSDLAAVNWLRPFMVLDQISMASLLQQGQTPTYQNFSLVANERSLGETWEFTHKMTTPQARCASSGGLLIWTSFPLMF